MSAGIGTAPTQTTLAITNTVGVSTGDFLQVDNEVMRVIQKQNATQLTVYQRRQLLTILEIIVLVLLSLVVQV